MTGNLKLPVNISLRPGPICIVIVVAPKKSMHIFGFPDLTPGEASEEEMELFTPAKSSSSSGTSGSVPRRKSSRGSDISSKRKFMPLDIPDFAGKPEKEPLQFARDLYDDGKAD